MRCRLTTIVFWSAALSAGVAAVDGRGSWPTTGSNASTPSTRPVFTTHLERALCIRAAKRSIPLFALERRQRADRVHWQEDFQRTNQVNCCAIQTPTIAPTTLHVTSVRDGKRLWLYS